MFCFKLSADRGSIPLISTDFVHPVVHSCPSPAELSAAWPDLRRRVGELVAATGNHPAVYLLEIDAYGSSSCMLRRGDLGQYEALLRYEVDRVGSLPHAVVYLEAGYSDSNSASYTARALNNSDIGKIRGFFTNDTHFVWTIDEVHWANRIARATGGAHYIVNTAENGNGPKHNPDPVHQGNEQLCNPPGRALGPRDTTQTGFRYADGFLWEHVPGNSGGTCGVGDPPGSTFWPARALAEAARANDRLGPRYPSRPY
jgi:endoglucanase